MSLSPSRPPASPTPNEKTVDALLRDGQPDWEAIGFEVLCSRCGYNLRMLPQPRCPECGLEFRWRAVLDATAWKSKFLFEHHWRTRFVRSWLKTTWSGLRPFRFWRNVSIHDHVRPGPLWFLLLTSVLWFEITMNVFAWLAGLALAAILQAVNPGSFTPQWQWLHRVQRIMSRLPDEFGDLDVVPWTLGFLLVSLLAALAMLCGLRQTLGRCRVRAVQILRVVAYASTPMFMCLGPTFAVVLALAECVNRSPSSSLALCLGIGGLILLLACPTLFLFAGLRRYLHLPRAALLAATAVFVGALFAVTAFLFLGTYIMG
jgi:hypothetical protein